MKTKHTQGEWTLANNEIDKRHQFSLVAFTNNGCKSIADIWLHPKNPQESEANAKIIAAAPDLLAIVKKISAMQGRSWKKMDKDTLGYKWAIEMDLAIKKATL